MATEQIPALEALSAEEIRRRMIWLGAEEAVVRNLAYTRALTADERGQLARLHAERQILACQMGERRESATVELSPAVG